MKAVLANSVATFLIKLNSKININGSANSNRVKKRIAKMMGNAGIRLVSPETFLHLSYGEVTKPETIDWSRSFLKNVLPDIDADCWKKDAGMINITFGKREI